MSTIIYDRGNQFERQVIAYSPITPATGPGSLDSMRKNLENAKVYHEKTRFTFYVRRCQLLDIVSYGAVGSVLSVLSPRSDSFHLSELCNIICGGPMSRENMASGTSYRRLFAILVYIGHAKDIFEFVARGIDDSKMPFSITKDRKRLTLRSSGRQIDVARPPDWDERVVDDFLRVQFSFISPFFVQPRDNSILHYHLDKDEILPLFSRISLPQEYRESAMVERIELDPQHYDFGDYGFQNPETPRQLFALKKYSDPQRFQAEVNFANRIKKIRNDHLNKLLVSFVMPEQYCLVFPWADCDMDSYWSEHAPETWDIKWIAAQCRGLASALAVIHNDDESQVQADLPRERRLYGRHGDIKPSNILWFKNHAKYNSGGVLALSDFEFGCFHRESSRSMIRDGSIQITQKYKPPELAVEDGRVDRSLDIWCLGATFVELVTWRVRGYEAVHQTFTEARRADAHHGGHRLESFFRLTKRHSGPEVKPSVTAWIRGLQAEIRSRLPSAAFLDSLLGLVESDMLIVDAKRRITAKDLEIRLSRLYEGS